MMPEAFVWRALSSVARFREGYCGLIESATIWRVWLRWRTG